MSRMRSQLAGRTSRTAISGVALALLAAAMMLGGFAGLTSQKLPFDPGFKIFLGGVALSLAALAVSLMGWRRTRAAKGRNLAWAGIIISLLLIAPMLRHIIAGVSVPPIHDITTDTDNPPAFMDILPLRADAPNSPEYGGADLAKAQKSAYPDIAPLLLAVPPSEAFSRAQKLVAARGWTIVSAVQEDGRIEATAETRLMKFKDDVVIRIAPTDAGSRIDMRSVSRVGQGDLGVNARRIADFLAEMNAP